MTDRPNYGKPMYRHRSREREWKPTEKIAHAQARYDSANLKPVTLPKPPWEKTNARDD